LVFYDNDNFRIVERTLIKKISPIRDRFHLYQNKPT
jgi:hypothetical protein